MVKAALVKVTENFVRNLDDLEAFLGEAGVPEAFDALLDELVAKVIPSLERFPAMGRPFLERTPQSVEAENALAALRAQSALLTSDMRALREYVSRDHLILYALIGRTVFLLAIKHQRQWKFDLDS